MSVSPVVELVGKLNFFNQISSFSADSFKETFWFMFFEVISFEIVHATVSEFYKSFQSCVLRKQESYPSVT